MHDARPKVLVTGATGQQGGAAATHLLAAGWDVHALVRTPESAAATRLARAGATLVAGDIESPETLDQAMRPVSAVFAVTPNETDPAREIRQGTNLVDAAVRQDVRHFVFASVGAAERSTGLPFWESKWEIERHLDASGIPATVLRPVRFMENHTVRAPLGGIDDGELVHVFAPDVPVQLIAVDDIGAFVALALDHPEEYVGQAIELAGDELPSTRIVELISEATGHPVTYRQWTGESSGMGAELDDAHAPVLRLAEELSAERGLWQADIPALRARHPHLKDFPTWLARGGAQRIAAILRHGE
ncbi:NmrA/HSCARG family protein [Spiractinospora alimapuensis]|uniref:NmrA/HSCARG family protein n=1 Tax=Spiractinospora alimapuensis TaxID=2820884 RepID=UPI001F371D04|nr:NmrA/HSCARG family protein [Spiractinospora alimapuensis]QVQ54169.1 NmrA/HSCARG family protein [Spiractinospora alimapuensis]